MIQLLLVDALLALALFAASVVTARRARQTRTVTPAIAAALLAAIGIALVLVAMRLASAII